MRAVRSFFSWNFVRIIRHVSLGRKLAILILSTVLVILFYCLMVFLITSFTNSRQEREEYVENSYYYKEELLKTYLSRLDYTAYSIVFSNWVQRFMFIDRISSNAEFQQYQRNATHFLTSLASINDDLSFVLISGSAMIWSNNTLHYDLKYNIKEQAWFGELEEKQKYIEYGKSELFAGLGDVWSMTLYYPVKSYFNFSPLGYLVINVTADKLAFLLNRASENREEVAAIYDREGAVIVSNIHTKGDRQEIIPSGPNSTKLTRTLMDGQWTLKIGVTNTLNPFDSLGSLNFIFLLLIPIIFLFIMIITAFSRYLTAPIIKCKNAMLAIRRKEFGIKLENHYYDEIGELISGFNDMSIDLAALIRKNEEISATRREAEIEMLQQKVNPHFLYNTLEIINALVLGGQDKNAIQVCEMLGAMYHYNLMNRKWVTLSEECEYVKRYLAIARYRISELSIFWDIGEDTMNGDILKLIIQPLVENAVLHGLNQSGSKKDGACLTITIRRIGGKIEISVMDNGIGISRENIALIEDTMESIRSGVLFENPHVGISNVYQRLYLEYGDDMDFMIESRLNYGTKFSFAIPAKRPVLGSSLP